MNLEKCPKSLGEDCFRVIGTECLLPEYGVCGNFVNQRAEFINSLAIQYVEMRNALGNRPPFSVNENAVYIATKSIYDDIYRYRMYHLADPRSKLADSVKLSAYTCKWIPRIKIIEYKNPESKKEDDSDDISGLLINIEFSLHMARTYIGAELSQIIYFKDHYEDEFVYDLFYRELNADGLLHIFQNIFSAVKAKRAGVLDLAERRTQK